MKKNDPLKSDRIMTYIKSSSTNRSLTTFRDWLVVGDVMTPDVVTISADMSVSAAAGKMAEGNISCVFVEDKGVLAGVVTERDIVNRVVAENRDSNAFRVADVMIQPNQSIPPSETVYRASGIMEAGHIKQLPVIDKDRLVGVVTQTDLVRVLVSYGMWKNVEEIMNRDVATIQKERPVNEAAELMSSRSISCIVVLEGEAVTGIFTERDFLKKIVVPRKNPWFLKMCDVMSSPVVSIPQDYSVFSANKLMEQKKIRQLVVQQDGRLCGIVSQTDMFTAVKSKLQEDEDENLKLLELSENGIYTTDTAGRITYVNPALQRLLGISGPDDLMGQTFLPEKFWAEPETRFQTMSETKGESLSPVRELALKTAKGTAVYVNLFETDTRNIYGELTESQGIIHDITRQKTADLALQKAHDELEQRVQERTAELRKEIEERKQAEEELKEALLNIKTLKGLLPICASCKKIRDDKGYWNKIEVYIKDHSEADFTHSVCPECAKKLYPEVYEDK